ncbi:MAG TPA: hemerythrin domain-containing protein [Oleiagrimonas sp.]|nr:hemerythrin domain-containing protein [Oleiagrimonas sp.]
MGFFRRIFGKDDYVQPMAVSEPPRSTKPASISYDPKLIDSLHTDHARLGALYERIGKHDKAGEYAQVRTLLAHFKSSLQAHILTENVRFYAYLENALADDAENARTMHEFRRDMNTIAREVVNFVKAWQNSDFASTAERQQFTAEYEKVGGLLEQRLDSEENSLYPLYQPT